MKERESASDALTFFNPTQTQLKRWQGLLQPKGRKKEGLFLAEGLKVVRELMASNWAVESILIMEEKRENFSPFLPPWSKKAQIYLLPASKWKKLTQDKTPEGVMAVVPCRRLKPSSLPNSGRLLFLYGIKDPNNLGAIMRSACWFGFSQIVLSPGSTDAYHPKAVRTSMGSLFYLSFFFEVDFSVVIPQLKKKGFSLVAGDPRGGQSPHPLGERVILLLGSESHGLPQELLTLADELWHIPKVGLGDSLSLPQAAAIMMYAATRKEENYG